MRYNEKFVNTIYNRDWLWKMYVEENRNAYQLARIIGCDTSTVLRWLRKFDIPVKTMSEAVKLAPHPGSHAPRPRRKFADTLHNKEWLKDVYENKGMNASEIAKEAVSSVYTASLALERAGYSHSQSNAMMGRPCIKRKPDEELSEITLRKRARASIPEGPCIICGKPGQQVNHKDRNPRNYTLENLELLCPKCHSKQHALELHVMIEMLKSQYNVPYIEIHQIARDRMIEPETEV
jgi:hypothetical protein